MSFISISIQEVKIINETELVGLLFSYCLQARGPFILVVWCEFDGIFGIYKPNDNHTNLSKHKRLQIIKVKQDRLHLSSSPIPKSKRTKFKFSKIRESNRFSTHASMQ